MSKHIFGHKAQRRMFVATAAAASMLLATGGPLAAADTGSKNHNQSGGKEVGTSNVTSPIKRLVGSARRSTGSLTDGTQVSPGIESTVLHHSTDPVHNPLVSLLTGGMNGQHRSNALALTNQKANIPTANQTSAVTNAVPKVVQATPISDPGLMTSPTLNIFGLLSNTSFANPGDNEFIATIFTSALFTDTLTSGADPVLGLGVPGEDVNILHSNVFPFLDSTIAVPVTDPFAPIFTALIPLGF